MFNPRDTDVINRHLSDERQKHLEDNEKPITADEMELDVIEDFEEDVRNMLRKHSRLWTGKLGQINAADMHIDVVPDAKPFMSAPYRVGPKTRQLEQNEINRKLTSGVIEPAMSEWAAPVLFAAKKDGRLRFCID